MKSWMLKYDRIKVIAGIAVVVFSAIACMETASTDSKPLEASGRNETRAQLIDTIPATWPSRDELLGRFDPSKNPGFTRIGNQYTMKSEIYMRTEAFDAFCRMYEAAGRDGIKLTIVSATRNFNYQKTIWEKKWAKPQYMGWQAVDRSREIMKFSAMPGTSRHHWGTDVDLNELDNTWFETGEGLKVYTWLLEHAHSYGYYQTYTKLSDGRTGYSEEKWHWSYWPLARIYQQAYNALISYGDIQGFSGSDSAQQVRAIEDYVNGVAVIPVEDRSMDTGH